MINYLKKYITIYKEKKRFNSLPLAYLDYVFYLEGQHDWPHLGPIIKRMLELNQKVCYLTSDLEDPRLKFNHKLFRSFYIGEGFVRSFIFKTIKAHIMIMSIPDLNCFHLKKSYFPVHYVYVFHSMCSSHMIYRKQAFDHYDTIFTVGPFHIAEIQKHEKINYLPPKNLIPHGYARLDTLYKKLLKKTPNLTKKSNHTILLAPTWGNSSIIEHSCVFKLIDLILSKHFLELRIHPMTKKHSTKIIEIIKKKYHLNPNFVLQTNMDESNSYYNSDILISDWSGTALEFAFSCKKPIIFINTPPKVNNTDYSFLNITPLEKKIRKDLGLVLDIKDINQINDKISYAIKNKNKYLNEIEQTLKRSVFNLHQSAKIGASNLIKIKRSLKKRIPNENKIL